MQRSGIDTIKYHTWSRIPMGKWQTHSQTPQTRAKRSALSQQVTTKHTQTDVHKDTANTRQNKNIKDPQKKHRPGTASKTPHWRARTGPTAPPPPPPKPRCGPRHIDTWLAWKTPKPSMHHLLKHTNQDITRRQSKDKDSTANKTEHRSKRNPTGKPRRAQQMAKASGPHHPFNRQVPKSEPS